MQVRVVSRQELAERIQRKISYHRMFLARLDLSITVREMHEHALERLETDLASVRRGWRPIHPSALLYQHEILAPTEEEHASFLMV